MGQKVTQDEVKAYVKFLSTLAGHGLCLGSYRCLKEGEDLTAEPVDVSFSTGQGEIINLKITNIDVVDEGKPKKKKKK